MTFRDKLYIIKCNFIEYWLQGKKFLDFRAKYPRPLEAKDIKKILSDNDKNIFLEIGMGKGEDKLFDVKISGRHGWLSVQSIFG